MKLILCRACMDVISLRSEPRTCTCGKSGGNYKADGLHSVIWGEAIPLGFNNIDFARALQHRPECGRGETFTAFVIAENCATVEYKESE